MELGPNLDPEQMKKPQGGRPPKHNVVNLLSVIASTTQQNPTSIKAWSELLGIARQTLNDYVPQKRSKGLIRTLGEGKSARQYITTEGLKLLNPGREVA